MSNNPLTPRTELALLGIFAICTCTVFMQWEVTELFFQFARRHEQWELDELALSVSTTLSFYAIIFAVRRWVENRTLSVHANTDSLTGLYNRRMMRHCLALEMTRARRYQQPLSFILFDLDHFKAINDSYGHAIGDVVLKEVARIAQSNLRSGDLLARWGGEEFLLLAPATDSSTVQRIADQVRQQIAAHAFVAGSQVTISAGVAQWNGEDPTEALLSQVDANLYRAKQAGRNQVYG